MLKRAMSRLAALGFVVGLVFGTLSILFVVGLTPMVDSGVIGWKFLLLNGIVAVPVTFFVLQSRGESRSLTMLFAIAAMIGLNVPAAITLLLYLF